ncbi:MAG: ABC transporter permease [Nitrospinota bacterium]
MRRAREAFQNSWPTVLTAVVLLGLWEAAIHTFRVPKWFIPAPSAVLKDLILYEGFYEDAWITTQEILLGFVIGDILAVAIAVAVVFSKFVQRTLYPIVVFFQNIPKVTLAPIMLLWFGLGLETKVAIVILISFFPVIINTIYGLRSVDPNLIDLARSVAVSRWMILRKIQIPHALPYMFEGFKIAMTFSVIGAFVAEWISGSNGLGYQIRVASSDMESAALFGAVAVISVIGVVLYYLVSLAGRKLFPWHESAREAGPMV